MSENEWVYQLSVKIEGQHLLNLRANDAVAFKDSLAWATENREPILAACAALEGARTPDRPVPAPTSARGPVAVPGGAEREIGPIQIENVEIKKGPREGPPWKSPMYVLRYEGVSASTFDKLIGQAAMGFWTEGHACYLTVEPSPKNPKFNNVVSIRMAAQ